MTAARTENRTTMKNFEFSIIASGLDPESEDFEQRFHDAGCDDATVSFQKGRIIVDFTREAGSIDDAVVSAMKNVEAAGARVDRIEPDPLVSLSDIATRSGMSRAAMTQYSKGQRGSAFPAPVARVTSESPLWDWATVARWLFQNEKISRDVAIEAEAIRAANAATGAREAKLQEVVQKSMRSYEKRLASKAA
ncbi:MAG TPA: hypothetical protein VFQ87_03830 [Bradyrhizobium sp.]|nr:hypothetical protein [Bradyrhizobium sp.]